MSKTVVSVIFTILLILAFYFKSIGYRMIGNIGSYIVMIAIFLTFFADIKEHLKNAFLIMLVPIIFMLIMLVVMFFTLNNTLIIASASAFYISLFIAILYAVIKYYNGNDGK